METTVEQPPLRQDDRAPVPGFVREVLVVAIGYGAYTLVRRATTGGMRVGLANAVHIGSWESMLHLDPERAINGFFSDHRWLAAWSGWYYATLHFVVTIGVMVWLHRRRPTHYRYFRTGLVLCNYLALGIFLLWPLAPPRLAEPGFDDVVVSAHIWGSFANKNLASTADQYAAMPSLHTAWSLWSGLAIALLAERWWARILGVLYPVATVLVIMGTGNHYILDAVAGAALLLVALSLSPPVMRLLDRWHITWLGGWARLRAGSR
jgi:hypothetical protein